MKTTFSLKKYLCPCLCLALAVLLFSLAARPANAKPATIVGGVMTADTTWTAAGSPYQVDTYLTIDPGVTLTIEAGVTVENYAAAGSNYNFTVYGALVANGTAEQPIYFKPGLTGWSGIQVTGEPGNIITGTTLTHVIVDGGGFGNSGVGANLVLQYCVVDVYQSQFNNSPGDGILGNDVGAGGTVNIYGASITGNDGYAILFENGTVNPILHDLTATGNGAELGIDGNLVFISDDTLSPGLHIWENMGLPYLILGTVVGPDTQLTIEPGVQVLAYPANDNLDIWGGVLEARGTAAEPIHFDPFTPTLGWSGISIEGWPELPSSGAWLDHVIITKGGFAGNCDINIKYGNATVTNSRLDSSEDSGLCLDNGATLTMTDTQLTNNQEYAMVLLDAGARYMLDNLSASGNLSDTIGIKGGIMGGPHTWPKSGINTYDIYGYVTVAPTGTLIVEPGVNVLLAYGSDITVQGRLVAAGTPTQPITFTGETPEPGQWAGINFEGTAEQRASGLFSYATVEYAGYGGSSLVSLYYADVVFNHCLLRNCSNNAITVYPEGATGDQAALAQAGGQAHLSWSQLTGNGGHAINNETTEPIQAAYNWWGAPSGPTADGNPGGTGGTINGPANIWPYLVAPEAKFMYLPLVRR